MATKIHFVNDAVTAIKASDSLSDEARYENVKCIFASAVARLAVMVASDGIGFEYYKAAHDELMKAVGWGD